MVFSINQSLCPILGVTLRFSVYMSLVSLEKPRKAKIALGEYTNNRSVTEQQQAFNLEKYVKNNKPCIAVYWFTVVHII